MYFQFLFAIDRVKALAPQHPEWRTEEPFNHLMAGDMKSFLAGEMVGAFEESTKEHALISMGTPDAPTKAAGKE
jgi:hypothetical protein